MEERDSFHLPLFRVVFSKQTAPLVSAFSTMNRNSTPTRRRWLLTGGLWGLATGLSLKGLSSLTHREQRQIEQRLTQLGKTWDDLTKEQANLNEQPASLPEPTLQERHPEYFLSLIHI